MSDYVELTHQEHVYDLPEAQASVEVSIRLLGPDGTREETIKKIVELYPWLNSNLDVVASILKQTHSMLDGSWKPPQAF